MATPMMRDLILGVTGLALLSALTASCSSGARPAVPTDSPSPVETPRDGERFTFAKVLEVIDGVTIDVEIDGQRFRVAYLGVAVPDSEASGANRSSLGDNALSFNRFSVENQVVELERGDLDTDPSGHLLRYVFVNGEMVNLALLTNGYVSVAGYPTDFAQRTAFVIAEESAKRSERGIWEAPAPDNSETAPQTPTPTRPPFGGTLPIPPDMKGKIAVCDYSGTSQPVIKGNVDSRTSLHVFHVPGGFFYATTLISEADGDRWFCTEAEALEAGWKRSKH